jgi:hypothetical protein
VGLGGEEVEEGLAYPAGRPLPLHRGCCGGGDADGVPGRNCGGGNARVETWSGGGRQCDAGEAAAVAWKRARGIRREIFIKLPVSKRDN